MRKHPLLAFATTTLGLAIGATSLGATGATASPFIGHRLNVATASLIAHRQAIGHRDRVSNFGSALTGGSVILSKTGPLDVLLPRLPRPRKASNASADAHIWAMLRACESGNNYRENSGNGFYGAYQFTITSWTHVGGTGLPNFAPPAVQDAAARRLRAIQGWHAWPICSAVLGYA